MSRCLIGLGSNLGDRQSNLNSAISRLDSQTGISVTSVSRWIDTNPIGGPDGQGGFLNGAAVIETSFKAEELLQRLISVESALGRERKVRWDARTLDMDILLFDDVCLNADGLTIPHPRMICRRFVLEPAAEVASDWVYPELNWTVGKLLEHLNEAPPHFALCGFRRKALHRIVEQVVEQSSAKLLAVDDVCGPSICYGAKPNPPVESASEIVLLETVDETKSISAWQPKLFVVAVGIGSSSERQQASALRDELAERQLGPVVTISSSDPVAVNAEIIAAIEAMR